MIPSKTEQIQQAVELIISCGKQFEIIDVLLKSLEGEFKSVSSDRAEYKASLRAIQKINAGKSEMIDALCDT